jgi:hypothetical protein
VTVTGISKALRQTHVRISMTKRSRNLRAPIYEAR